MIDSRTRILGLIGHPLGHSLSPHLHNYYLNKIELNYVYLAFDIKPGELKVALKGLKALNFRGANITIPYKEDIIDYLDEIDDMAAKIGAVNTVVNEKGKLYGYNTDAPGFIQMLEDEGGFEIKGKRVLIIGAGGASRAVGFALCQSGIEEITLLNRTKEKAKLLVQIWKKYYPEVKFEYMELKSCDLTEIVPGINLIVDTTPVGMSPKIDVEPVIPAEYLHSEHFVVDLVYNPLETTLIKAARSKGARTLNGLGMLLYQGIEAFKLWTGYKPEAGEIGRNILIGEMDNEPDCNTGELKK